MTAGGQDEELFQVALEAVERRPLSLLLVPTLSGGVVWWGVVMWRGRMVWWHGVV